MRYFLILVVFLCSGATLEWDFNPEVDVIGYRVYVGQASRVYNVVLDVGNINTVQIPTDPNTTNYFAVTAYNSDGLESDYSEEVFYIPNNTNPPPTNICNFTIFPASRNHSSDTQIGAIDVSTDTNCFWQINNNKFWITIISPLTNLGPKTITYRIDANTNIGSRSGSFSVAGLTFTVSQNGANISPTNIIPPVLRPRVVDGIFYASFDVQANVWYDVDYTTDFIVWWPIYSTKREMATTISLDFWMNDPRFFLRVGAHN